jgi:hypothetical protein
MKKHILRLLCIALILCLLFTFIGCNKKDNNINEGSGDSAKTPPPANQLAEAGLVAFNAEVTGTLTTSSVQEGKVQMKYENSNEASLDAVIDWLKESGYTSLDGQTATKENDLGIISYVAEKVVDGTPMTAEATYFTENKSIGGMSFKAGDLYVSVSETENTYTPPVVTNEWPSETILSTIGEGVPAFAGTINSISAQANTLVYPMVSISIGTTESDIEAYKATLLSGGYAVVNDAYVKELANGNKIGITITSTLENNYSISIRLDKASGEEGAWPTAMLNEKFPGITIPVVEGAESFDVSDCSTTVGGITVTMVQITAYGYPEEKLEEYEAVLLNAGYAKVEGNFEKAYGEGRLVVSLTPNGTQMIIVLTIKNEETGGEEEPPVDTLGFDDLPTNIKLTYELSNSGTTSQVVEFTKIGNDWLVYDTISNTYMYYKFAGAWAIYTRDNNDGGWSNSGTIVSDLENDTYFENLGMILDNDVDGYTTAGTVNYLGQSCSHYVESMSGSGYSIEVIKYLNAEGFCLYKNSSQRAQGQTIEVVHKITLWDTTVSSFSITVP